MMGWTYTNKPKQKHQKVIDFFRDEFDGENEKGTWKVLDCAVVNLRTAYLAMERVPADGKRFVFGMVCLLEYRRNDHYNFGYKDMDETMGPYYYDCPKRILDLLTPTDHESANEWRAKCREVLAKKANAPKIKVGDVLQWEKALIFSDGSQPERLQVQSVRPLRLTIPGCYGLFTVSRLALAEARIVQPEGG